MQQTLPVRFQLRAEVQALVNALRRPTSDALKLLRLVTNARATLDGSDIAHPELRRRLTALATGLESGTDVDRARVAAELSRTASEITWSARDFAAMAPQRMRLRTAV